MAIPKGSRTRTRPAETPTKIKNVELVCKVTGKPFTTYEGAKPVSLEGWSQLSDEQKFRINKGEKLEDVL